MSATDSVRLNLWSRFGTVERLARDMDLSPEPLQEFLHEHRWDLFDAPSLQYQKLYGVAFSDSQHGIAVGHDETILRTEDAGETWTTCPGPIPRRANGWPAAYRAVEFYDARNGWIVGDAGSILRTSDGGSDWKLLLHSARKMKWLYATAHDRQQWGDRDVQYSSGNVPCPGGEGRVFQTTGDDVWRSESPDEKLLLGTARSRKTAGEVSADQPVEFAPQ